MASKVFDDETALNEFIKGGGHGVKGLAEQGLAKVPQKFIRPPHERILIEHPNPTLDSLHHPIDLTGLFVDGPDYERVVDKILRAAETLGYFQVVNHGVPAELLEAVKGVTHEFFEQPAEKKMVYSTDRRAMYMSGYVNEKESVWDWRDSLTLAHTSDAEAIEIWPSQCKEIMLEYMKVASKVSNALLKIFLGKGASADDSNSEGFECSKVVHMNYYPSCPNPELTTGTRCHSDKSLITVLLQDGIGGLSVKAANNVLGLKKGDWINIPPVDGALVINVGDMLQVLSNGRYRSPEHRVRTSKISSRISVAVFTLPVLSQKVGPLPQAIAEANGVAFYKEFIYRDYLINYVSTVHTGERPLDFAEISNNNA